MVRYVSRKGRRISRPSEWNSGVNSSRTRGRRDGSSVRPDSPRQDDVHRRRRHSDGSYNWTIGGAYNLQLRGFNILWAYLWEFMVFIFLVYDFQ